jgi:hypothetical protein
MPFFPTRADLKKVSLAKALPMDLLLTIFGLFLFGLFLIYGFKDDVKRSPRRFIRTLIATPLAMIVVPLGFTSLADKLKRWMNTGKI